MINKVYEKFKLKKKSFGPVYFEVVDSDFEMQWKNAVRFGIP